MDGSFEKEFNIREHAEFKPQAIRVLKALNNTDKAIIDWNKVQDNWIKAVDHKANLAWALAALNTIVTFVVVITR